MTLNDTVIKMNSDDYQDRFIAEYEQLLIRTYKLKDFIRRCRYTGEGLNYCSITTLEAQYHAMALYLDVLERRAYEEKITLPNKMICDIGDD